MDKIQTLLETVDENEKASLTIFYNGMVSTAGAYKENSTQANMNNWTAAREGLDKEVDRLWAKYFKEKPAFKNMTAVLKFLQDEGYKIKKTKLYEDEKKGKIKKQSDGKVFRSDVDSYILRTELKRVAEKKIKDLDENSGRKTEKEIELLERRIENLEMDIKVKRNETYPREEVRSAWVQRVTEIRAGLLALEHRLPPLLEGKDQKTIRPIIREETRSLLNNFTRAGKFTPNVEDEING